MGFEMVFHLGFVFGNYWVGLNTSFLFLAATAARVFTMSLHPGVHTYPPSFKYGQECFRVGQGPSYGYQVTATEKINNSRNFYEILKNNISFQSLNTGNHDLLYFLGGQNIFDHF
jgi:hypothetical protein